eukprot:Rmarinus@m.26364
MTTYWDAEDCIHDVLELTDAFLEGDRSCYEGLRQTTQCAVEKTCSLEYVTEAAFDEREHTLLRQLQSLQLLLKRLPSKIENLSLLRGRVADYLTFIGFRLARAQSVLSEALDEPAHAATKTDALHWQRHFRQHTLLPESDVGAVCGENTKPRDLQCVRWWCGPAAKGTTHPVLPRPPQRIVPLARMDRGSQFTPGCVCGMSSSGAWTGWWTGSRILLFDAAGLDHFSFVASPEPPAHVTFSSDDTLCLVEARPWSVDLYEMRSGRQLWSVVVPKTSFPPEISPDGTCFAIVRRELTHAHAGVLELWDAYAPGEVLAEIVLPDGLLCLGFAFDASGARIACATNREKVFVTSPFTGQLLHEIPANLSPSPSLSFHPRLPHLLLVEKEHSAELWDLRTETAAEPPLTEGAVVRAVFGPEDSVFLIDETDEVLYLWDPCSLANAPLLNPYPTLWDSCRAVRFWADVSCNPATNSVYIRTGTGFVRWDGVSKKEIPTNKLPRGEVGETVWPFEEIGESCALSADVTHLEWSLNEPLLAISATDTVTLWHTTRNTSRSWTPIENADVTYLCFSSAGSFLSFGAGWKVIVWVARQNTCVELNLNARIFSAAFSPDEKLLCVGFGAPSGYAIIDLTDWRIVSFQLQRRQRAPPMKVLWYCGRENLLLHELSEAVHLMDMKTAETIWQHPCRHVRYFPAQSTLILYSQKLSAFSWAATRVLPAPLFSLPNDIPSARYLDDPDRTCLASLDSLHDTSEMFSLSPDGTMLAVCGRPHVIIWLVEGPPRPLYVLRGHKGCVRSLSWTKVGGLASGGRDGVRLWKIPEVCTLRDLPVETLNSENTNIDPPMDTSASSVGSMSSVHLTDSDGCGSDRSGNVRAVSPVSSLSSEDNNNSNDDDGDEDEDDGGGDDNDDESLEGSTSGDSMSGTSSAEKEDDMEA